MNGIEEFFPSYFTIYNFPDAKCLSNLLTIYPVDACLSKLHG